MEVNGYLITLGNCNKYMLKDFILSVIATTFVCCLCASCGITKMNTYRNGYIMDSKGKVIGYYANGYIFDDERKVKGNYSNGYVYDENKEVIATYANGYMEKIKEK